MRVMRGDVLGRPGLLGIMSPVSGRTQSVLLESPGQRYIYRYTVQVFELHSQDTSVFLSWRQAPKPPASLRSKEADAKQMVSGEGNTLAVLGRTPSLRRTDSSTLHSLSTPYMLSTSAPRCRPYCNSASPPAPTRGERTLTTFRLCKQHRRESSLDLRYLRWIRCGWQWSESGFGLGICNE
jgi:hypothetical protein